MEENPVFSAVRQEVVKHGLRACSRRLGIPIGQLRGIMEKQRMPRFDNLVRICEALNIRISMAPAHDKHFHYPALNSSLIPLYDIDDISDPTTSENKNIKTMIALDASWIQGELKIDPRKLACFRMSGDSMEPLLRSEEIAVMHIKNHNLNEGVWCLRIDGTMTVRRVGPLAVSYTHLTLPTNREV